MAAWNHEEVVQCPVGFPFQTQHSSYDLQNQHRNRDPIMLKDLGKSPIP